VTGSGEETREQRIQRLVAEEIAIVAYDPRWPQQFRAERDHLGSCLPRDVVRRIEHFGSTAVPGLAAKPIVDMLVEVSDLEAVEARVVPLLESQGYDYLWRPTHGEDTPPFYAWFIKRDAAGRRTHHIHMVERHFEHWDRLLFRDYLIEYPAVAREYARLKLGLAAELRHDRVGYTQRKTEFVLRTTQQAKLHYGQGSAGERG